MTDQRPRHENPVTGEYVTVLTDPLDHPEEALVAELTVTPGGRVAAPHHHPTLTERFHVIEGRVDFMLDGEKAELGPGDHATVAKNVVHDWWQVGEEPALVVAEVTPGFRFGEMITHLFGLAREGKLNAEGMPSPLQLAVIGNEFKDVIVFESPPPIVQRLTLPLLAAIGRARGLTASDAGHREGEGTAAPDPRSLELLTPDGRLGSGTV